MDAPSNIQCFEYAAAALLGKLYQEFPRPLNILSADVESQLVKDLMIPQECIWPEHPTRSWENLTGATVLWLEEEGLVRYKSESSYRFIGVVLTAKGYSALNSPVLPPSGEETNGQKIVEFSKKAILSGISATISSVVQASMK